MFGTSRAIYFAKAIRIIRTTNTQYSLEKGVLI
jgi:hypothetical protein